MSSKQDSRSLLQTFMKFVFLCHSYTANGPMSAITESNEWNKQLLARLHTLYRSKFIAASLSFWLSVWQHGFLALVYVEHYCIIIIIIGFIEYTYVLHLKCLLLNSSCLCHCFVTSKPYPTCNVQMYNKLEKNSANIHQAAILISHKSYFMLKLLL